MGFWWHAKATRMIARRPNMKSFNGCISSPVATSSSPILTQLDSEASCLCPCWSMFCCAHPLNVFASGRDHRLMCPRISRVLSGFWWRRKPRRWLLPQDELLLSLELVVNTIWCRFSSRWTLFGSVGWSVLCKVLSVLLKVACIYLLCNQRDTWIVCMCRVNFQIPNCQPYQLTSVRWAIMQCVWIDLLANNLRVNSTVNTFFEVNNWVIQSDQIWWQLKSGVNMLMERSPIRSSN